MAQGIANGISPWHTTQHQTLRLQGRLPRQTLTQTGDAKGKATRGGRVEPGCLPRTAPDPEGDVRHTYTSQVPRRSRTRTSIHSGGTVELRTRRAGAQAGGRHAARDTPLCRERTEHTHNLGILRRPRGRVARREVGEVGLRRDQLEPCVTTEGSVGEMERVDPGLTPPYIWGALA